MTTKQPTIAITGASGFLGSELVRYFSKQGWQVRALVRNPAKQPKLPNVEYAAYDLVRPVLADTLKGVDYLVHAAYVKQEGGRDAMKVNVTGAKRLLTAAKAAKVKRRLFISSMSAHGEATSTYGLQKLAIEELFNTPSDVYIRSGLMVGNGGLVKQMADFMKSKHAVPLIGGGKQPLQTIGVYDLPRVIEAALLKNSLHGRLTIATPTIYTYKEFYRQLGQRLNVKFAYVPVPYWALSGVFRTVELVRLPLSVNRDNLIGLKNLRSAETAADLAKLDLEIDDLPTALKKTKI